MAKHYPRQPVTPNVEDPPCERCGGDPASCACFQEKHTSTPWIVIYHSHGDIFDVKVVEDKMIADGLAEDADKETDGNVETLSLPAPKLFATCNAHDALLEAVRLDVVDGECFCHAGPESWGRHKLGLGPGPCDYCVAKQAIALAEGGKE